MGALSGGSWWIPCRIGRAVEAMGVYGPVVKNAVAFIARSEVVRKMMRSRQRFTLMYTHQMVVESDDAVIVCEFAPRVRQS